MIDEELKDRILRAEAIQLYTENRCETLEKENKELKEQNRKLLESCEGATIMHEDLCEAIKIIKELLDFDFLPDVEVKRQAEQFLKRTR